MGTLVGYFIVGAILGITPIPLLPVLFFSAWFESDKNGLWEKTVFLVFNSWMLLFPLVCLVGAYKKGGELAVLGLAAGVSVVWQFLGRSRD